MPINTPVLFLVFNRPQLTASVFEAIRKARPAQLFIAADGPRKNKNEDDLCSQVRLIATQVDWPCEIHTLFREENLGCGKAVSEAISWFFDHVEQGIILEDDCIPNNSFFNFCNELLIKYAEEEKILMISGCSFQNNIYDNYSYYFSQYIHVWGWATWKRAWRLYDVKLVDFKPREANNYLRKVFKKPRERKIWIKNISHTIDGSINTWDYQWMHAIWKNNGLCIVPWKNLISNIGYGEDATHTIGFDSNTIALPTYQLADIIHSPQIKANKQADKYIRYKLIINKIGPLSISKKIFKRLINYKTK